MVEEEEPSDAAEPWRSRGGVLELVSGDEEYRDDDCSPLSILDMGDKSVEVDFSEALLRLGIVEVVVVAEGSWLSSETFRPDESSPYIGDMTIDRHALALEAGEVHLMMHNLLDCLHYHRISP